jgi:predicted nucleic acid-binding protein
VIVLDASVAVELLLGTPATERIAARLFDRPEPLHAPHLIDVEVAQVLRRYAARGELAAPRGRAALRLFEQFPLRRHGHLPLLERAWALRQTLTAYDAMYVALAEALGATLVTRDARLARAPGPLAPIEVIAGPARVAVRGGGVGFRLNRDGSVIVRTYHGLAVVRGSSPAGTWERSLPELQEVLVPASGPPPDNRKITREEGEGLWVLWNEEQDYVAYGGKAPLR